MQSNSDEDILSRFMEAGKVVFSKWGASRRFCLKYNINYSNLKNTLNGIRTSLPITWISAMVLEFGVSAEWILTGHGSMFSRDKIANK